MAHAETTRVQTVIGDPVGENAPVPRAKLEAIFADIQSDLRYDHELNGCLNCGICTATCPAAHYYDFSPREIVQLLWTENLEGIYDAMQEKICMESAKNVLRPFSRVMLKLISTGNQLSPDMINKDHFADWGPNISKVDAPLKLLRKAIPMPTLNPTATAWEVNLKASVELYTIWEMTGVLKQLEGIDENLFDVITDIMDEKREDWKDFLADQEDGGKHG